MYGQYNDMPTGMMDPSMRYNPTYPQDSGATPMANSGNGMNLNNLMMMMNGGMNQMQHQQYYPQMVQANEKYRQNILFQKPRQEYTLPPTFLAALNGMGGGGNG